MIAGVGAGVSKIPSRCQGFVPLAEDQMGHNMEAGAGGV